MCVRLTSLFVLCLALVVMPSRVWSQSGAGGAARGGEHRVALVVGNAAYPDSPLKNPVNDARAMRDKLKSMGFEVVYFENLRTKQIGTALREFRNLIRPGSVALFFYAGHGLQVRGENFLPTVDAELQSEEDVPNQSMSVSLVLNAMEDSKAGVNLVLLDACRNNPYARNFRSAASGLARVQAPSGTLIHYATRPGSVAADGTGKHGTYTAALLSQIDEKGVPIETALKRVTIRVRDDTKGKQEPWIEGSLTGDFYFISGGNQQVVVQQEPSNADAAAWQAADASQTIAAYQAYLVEYPKGLYAAAARIKLASLKAAAESGLGAPPTPLVAPATVAGPAAAGVTLLSEVPPGVKDVDGYVWRDVQARGRKEHYEAYLQRHPKGRFVALAQAKLKTFSELDGKQLAEQKARAEPPLWELARQTNTEEAFRIYLSEYPNGRFVAPANAALKTLLERTGGAAKPGMQTPTPVPEQQAAAPSKEEALRKAALRELSLTRVAGGEYQMGAEADELGEGDQVDAAAQPRHSVKVANFELAAYELTVAQFRKFVDATGYRTEAESANPSGCYVAVKGDRWVLQTNTSWRAPGYKQTETHPVVCLSWNDTQAYLQWLNGGVERYRLPSEAEWEFAARAGTTSPRPWADTASFFSRAWNTVKPWRADRSSRACRYANVADARLKGQLEWPDAFDCDDGYATLVPGAYFSRNNFGLYDMMGNAAEWTQDCWNDNHAGAPDDAQPRTDGDCTRQVVRGGSWASSQASIRSAARLSQPRSYRSADVGLRLARTPKE